MEERRRGATSLPGTIAPTGIYIYIIKKGEGRVRHSTETHRKVNAPS